MLIEGRRPLDPQPAHDRKTGPIDQRKILISPRQPDLPRSLQIGYPHRLQHRNPTAHPVPESLRSQPPQTMPQQRARFHQDMIGGHQRFARLQNRFCPPVARIACIRCRIPDRGIDEKAHRRPCRPAAPNASATIASFSAAMFDPSDRPRSKTAAGSALVSGRARSRATRRRTYSAMETPSSLARFCTRHRGSLQAWLLTRLLLVCHAPFAKHFSLKVPR